MKWIEQSNWAPSHLCGLKTTESACLDASPEVPEFGADHRRAGPRGVDMAGRARAVCAIASDGRDVVRAADAGAADAGDHARRLKARGAISPRSQPPARLVSIERQSGRRWAHADKVFLADA